MLCRVPADNAPRMAFAQQVTSRGCCFGAVSSPCEEEWSSSHSSRTVLQLLDWRYGADSLDVYSTGAATQRLLDRTRAGEGSPRRRGAGASAQRSRLPRRPCGMAQVFARTVFVVGLHVDMSCLLLSLQLPLLPLERPGRSSHSTSCDTADSVWNDEVMEIGFRLNEEEGHLHQGHLQLHLDQGPALDFERHRRACFRR